MSNEEIEKKVIAVVADQLGVSVELVKPETKLSEDLGTDSLDEVELVMAIEEELKIDIDDSKAEAIKTVQDVINVVTELVGGADNG